MPAKTTDGSKKQRGTYRQDRQTATLTGGDCQSEMPDLVAENADAARCWRDVVSHCESQDVPFPSGYRVTLELLCLAYARHLSAERELARDGITLENAKGERIKHPAAMISSSSASQYASLMGQFGLGPRSMSLLAGKIQHPEEEDPRDDFEF